MSMLDVGCCLPRRLRLLATEMIGLLFVSPEDPSLLGQGHRLETKTGKARRMNAEAGSHAGSP